MSRAVIYRRLTENPDGRTITLGAQEADGRDLAQRLDADVVRVITDDDLTAADPNIRRPGFEELLEGTLAGDWDTIIAVDQLRLLRRIDDLERVIAVCTVTGARVHYVQQGASDLESPEGKLYARFNALLGTYEVEKVKVRTKRLMAERARLGLPLAGTAGFGYRKTPDDNYEIVDTEANLIQDAARRVLANESLRSIAGDWNAHNIHTRRGNPWTAGNVRRVLLAPRTAGLREHRGTIVGPAAWPPILDEHTWRRVGRSLRAPDRRKTVAYDARLLTGIATCGICRDRTLNSGTARQGHRIYFCRHCRKISVQAAGLEQLAEKKILEAVEERIVHAVLDQPVDLEPIQAELDDIADREVELAVQWANGLPKAAWEAARSTLAERRATLERQVADAEQSGIVDWASTGDLAADWAAMTIDEKRHVARRMLRVLEVLPARKGRVPFDPARVRVETV